MLDYFANPLLRLTHLEGSPMCHHSSFNGKLRAQHKDKMLNKASPLPGLPSHI